MKYASKEGVKAAAVKGIPNVFKVTSICMVQRSKNTYEEPASQRGTEHTEQPSFSAVLDSAVEKEASASLNCHTCTYGADKKLQNFLYQSRDYTY